MRSAQRPTFHSDREGARDGAVGVGGFAFVLAVVIQGDVVEVEPAVKVNNLAGCVCQDTILFLPFHLRCGSAETDMEEQKDVTVRENRSWK